MKRVLPGTKSKKAIPAIQSAAKRSSAKTKVKSPKPLAAKSSATRKIKSAAAKTVVAKSKLARKKFAKLKVAAKLSKIVRKSAAPKRIVAAKPKRRVVVKRKVAKRVSTRVKQVRVEEISTAPISVFARPQPPVRAGSVREISRKTKLPPTSEAKTKVRSRSLRVVGAPATPTETAPTLLKVTRTIAPKRSRRFAARSEFPLPAFLLEGDESPHPASGSGEKFALGPTPPLDHFDEAKAPLPESYGTGRLFLTARDPHWLYAHWDFTMQEQFRYNAQSVDRHMVLRLHDFEKSGQHISEIHVHPESRHWFTHVEEAGKRYFVEIGYYRSGRKWKSLATSEPRCTPPDNVSIDATIEFATIPLELPFETMLALLKESDAPDLPLAHGIDQIRAQARDHFPQTERADDWTPAQEAALAELSATSRAGTAQPSSGEFSSEKIWPEFQFDSEADDVGGNDASSSYVSSFFGGPPQPDFWFNVNAELIVYGATEPNATVTFAGKQIPLRADGSFRFHFALPDGQYEMPVTAISADGTDGRAAELRFSRATEIRGDVAAAPTEPALESPPTPDV